MSRKITIHHVLTEAWSLIPGLKWPVFKRFLLILLIVIFLIIITILTFGAYAVQHKGSPGLTFHIVSFVLGVLAGYIGIKIFIPVIMMGVRRAIGMPIDIQLIKKECAKVKNKLSGLIIMYVLLINLIGLFTRLIVAPDTMGVLFCSIIGVACMFLLIPINIFAIPLIITRQMDLRAALDSAYKMMGIYWKEIIGAYLVISIIPAALQLLSLFLMEGGAAIGLLALAQLVIFIWLVPMTAIMGGIFFRDAYGLKKPA